MILKRFVTNLLEPLSFAEMNHTIRKGTKPILEYILSGKDNFPESWSVKFKGSTALFVDDFALMTAILKPEDIKDFQ